MCQHFIIIYVHLSFVFSESAEISHETPGPELYSDHTDSTSNSTTPDTHGSVSETWNRVAHTPDLTTLAESQTSTVTTRQRAHKSAPSERQPAQKLPAAEQLSEDSPFQVYQSRNGARDVPGKEVSAPVDPIKILDLMRCGGCLLVSFLTRWALSIGLGILFLEVRKTLS